MTMFTNEPGKAPIAPQGHDPQQMLMAPSQIDQPSQASDRRPFAADTLICLVRGRAVLFAVA